MVVILCDKEKIALSIITKKLIGEINSTIAYYIIEQLIRELKDLKETR